MLLSNLPPLQIIRSIPKSEKDGLPLSPGIRSSLVIFSPLAHLYSIEAGAPMRASQEQEEEGMEVTYIVVVSSCM